MATAVIVRPLNQGDHASKVMHRLGRHAKDALVKQRHSIEADLSSDRQSLQKALKRSSELALFFCHGRRTPAALLDANSQPLLDKDNCHLLKDKDVFAFACWFAEELGPIVHRKGGARSYVGFKGPGMFYRDDDNIHALADCISEGAVELAKGTRGQSLANLLQNRFLQWAMVFKSDQAERRNGLSYMIHLSFMANYRLLHGEPRQQEPPLV